MSIQPTKRSRASGEQLSAMLDFLGENPNVASGKFQKLHGKLENTKKWAEMADKLNSLGGAAKSVEQWQNVWRDLKSRTSTRVRDRKREQALTGNIPLQQPPLNELEKRVIALVGSSYMEGQPDVQENIPMEEELQLTLGAADENFRLVMEEDTMVIPPLTVSDGESEIRCETPKTPRQTPRRTAKRKHAEESPTKAKFLRIAEAQAESEKRLAESAATNAEANRSNAEAICRMAAATERMATATATMAEAFTVLAEGVKACAHAFAQFTNSLGPPQ